TMACGSFWSTVEAPRSAKSLMGRVVVSGSPGLPEAFDLRGREPAHLPRPHVAEHERPEPLAPQRGDAVADGLDHPADLALASFVDRQLELAGLDLPDAGRRRPAVLEVHALAQPAPRAL